MKDEQKPIPEEIFIEERYSKSSFIGAHTNRLALIGSRLITFNPLTGDKENENEKVFVYKFSHVEILKKKLDIIIERPDK